MNENGFKALAKHLPKIFQRKRSWAHIIVTNHPKTAAKLAKKKYTVPKGMKISIYTAVLNILSFTFSSETLNHAKAPSVSRHKPFIFILSLTLVIRTGLLGCMTRTGWK